MNRDRIEWHLENWRDYMQRDNSRLGYPSKSLMIASGGSSSVDSFEIMCDEVDLASARAIDSIIDGLKPPQKTAINHHWLNTEHHWTTHDMDYELALESIGKIADKRGLM